MTDADQRPLRVDAQRNRERILTAARQAFTELGPSVSLDEIARRADVSAMTLYRHFAGRDDLVTAVIERGIADDVQPVLTAALANPDPWQGLVDVIRAAVRGSTTTPAWRETIAAARDLGAPELARDRIFAPLGGLFRRAQEAGVVRADVEAADLPPIIGMLKFLVVSGDEAGDDAWLRYLTLMLRAPDPRPQRR